VTVVEGAFDGIPIRSSEIGIPLFDGGIEIEDTVIMAPLDDDVGIYVPRQVKQEVTSREVL
jgi:hypothetical protein